MLLFFFGSLYAQNHDASLPNCKAPLFHPAGMKKLVQAAGEYSRRSDSTLYIPVTINLLGTDQGTGYYSPPNVQKALCQLNEDFSPYGFQFYLEGSYKYINNSSFYDMADDYAFSPAMDQFIANHNTENTLNIYFVERTASMGGSSFSHWPLYDTLVVEVPWATNYPQDHAIVVRKVHAANNTHLLTHEVGHYFSLWHTFFGWEDTNYTNLTATPDSVTIKWIYPDSTYTCHIKVERVDGLDCENSGDFICDTPPDYLSIGFLCDPNMQSPLVQTDPSGAPFRSDGTYFMSYSHSLCQSQFSPGQVDIMRYYAEVTRSYLLYDQTPPGSFSIGDLNAIYPPNGGMASIVNDSITLEWDMPGADQYLLTYGFKPTPTLYVSVKSDILVTGNQYRVKISSPGSEQYWIVRGISKYHPCETRADTSYFHINTVGTSEDQLLESLELYPNPTFGKILIKGIDFKSVKLINHLGQILYTNPSPLNEIDISDFAPGIYFIQLDSDLGSITRKVLKL